MTVTPPPASPGQPDPDAAEAALIALYLWAQAALLARFTAILRAHPATQEGVQAAIAPMRAAVAAVQAVLIVRTAPLVKVMVEGFQERGAVTAALQVGALLGGGSGAGTPPRLPTPGTAGAGGFDLSVPHGVRAEAALRTELTHTLGAATHRLTRLPDDVYKAVAPHGSALQVLDNGWTPLQAQAVAWRQFMAHGVTGFTDVSGRRWQLSSYVEMAVRTGAMRAFNDSHIERMRALGIAYFQVPEHDTTCPLCFPWQGQVLSDGLQPDPGVHVAGTLNEAIAAGLFHPNCRHTLVAWQPGISAPPPPVQPWTDELQQRYADTQRQRALERHVRAQKQAAAHALDDLQAAHAHARVRAGQAALRELVASRPYLSRASHREQPHLNYGRSKLPAV